MPGWFILSVQMCSWAGSVPGRAVVSGTALMQEKGFQTRPPSSLIVQQRDAAVLPAAESALVLADAGADKLDRSPNTKSKDLCNSC